MDASCERPIRFRLNVDVVQFYVHLAHHRPDAEWVRVRDLQQPPRSQRREFSCWLALQFLDSLRPLTMPAGKSRWAKRARAVAERRAVEAGGQLLMHDMTDSGLAVAEVSSWIDEWAKDGPGPGQRPPVTIEELNKARDAILLEAASAWELIDRRKDDIIRSLATEGFLTKRGIVERSTDRNPRKPAFAKNNHHLDAHLHELKALCIVDSFRRDNDLFFRLVRLPIGAPKDIVEAWLASPVAKDDGDDQ